MTFLSFAEQGFERVACWCEILDVDVSVHITSRCSCLLSYVRKIADVQGLFECVQKIRQQYDTHRHGLSGSKQTISSDGEFFVNVNRRITYAKMFSEQNMTTDRSLGKEF